MHTATCPASQKEATSRRAYRPRRPRRSPLYRILEEHFESFLPPVDIAELFRREVLRAFVERELITESVARNMLSWPHSGFHVHLGGGIGGDAREKLKKTARYSARAPLALSRLTYVQKSQRIAYRYTNPYDHAEHTEKVTPHELIARLMTHIPDPGEHTTRYFGFYANRTRGKRRAVHGGQENAAEEREARAPKQLRRKWAERACTQDPRSPEGERDGCQGWTVCGQGRVRFTPPPPAGDPP